MHLEVDSILEPFASEHAMRVVKVDKVGEAGLITQILNLKYQYCNTHMMNDDWYILVLSVLYLTCMLCDMI